MPTFDFSNIINKLLRASLLLVANPITTILSVSLILTTLIDNITDWFDVISLDNIMPSISYIYDSDITGLLLYAIAWDKFVEVYQFIGKFIAETFEFTIKYFITTTSILITVGVTKIMRTALKSFFG